TKIDYHRHPNALVFRVFKDEVLLEEMNVKSIGGGEIVFNDEEIETKRIYPHKHFQDIKEYCLEKNFSLYEYVKEVEGDDIDEFLLGIWDQMKTTINNGLN